MQPRTVNKNNLTCVFVCVCVYVIVFPVKTTVEGRHPIASQETEQLSVPVHTGNRRTQLCNISHLPHTLTLTRLPSNLSSIWLLRPAAEAALSAYSGCTPPARGLNYA